MGVIDEVKQNGEDGEEEEEKENDAVEVQVKSHGDAHVEKLIEFSPNSTPTHETKGPVGEAGKENPPTVSESETGDKNEKRRSKDMDALSQTSIAEEDETMSNTSAKDSERFVDEIII